MKRAGSKIVTNKHMKRYAGSILQLKTGKENHSVLTSILKRIYSFKLSKSILGILTALLLIGILPSKSFGQDTIIIRTLPSTGSYKMLEEELKIMEDAMKEKVKVMKIQINTDSIMQNMEVFKDQMKHFSEKIVVIPDDFTFNFEHNFEKNVFATTVVLTGDSKNKEVVVKVEKEVPSLSLSINGEVRSGNVNVGIYDPKGKKQGSFSIENENNKDGETVNGSLNKNLSSPMIGDWKVKIESDKAKGNVIVTSIQKL